MRMLLRTQAISKSSAGCTARTLFALPLWARRFTINSTPPSFIHKYIRSPYYTADTMLGVRKQDFWGQGHNFVWGRGCDCPKDCEDMTYSRYHRKKGDELEKMR